MERDEKGRGREREYFLFVPFVGRRTERENSLEIERRKDGKLFFAAVVAARKLLRLVPKMKKVYSISNRLRLCPTRLLLPLSLFLMSVCHTFLGFSPELSLRFFPKSSFSPSSFLSSDSAIPFSIFSGEHTRALTDCRMPNQLLLPLRYLTKLSLSLSLVRLGIRIGPWFKLMLLRARTTSRLPFLLPPVSSP